MTTVRPEHAMRLPTWNTVRSHEGQKLGIYLLNFIIYTYVQKMFTIIYHFRPAVPSCDRLTGRCNKFGLMLNG